MHQRTITVAIALFVVLIAGMFVFAYLKKAELEEAVPVIDENPQEEPVSSPYDYINRIDAKHFFINGTHTIVGEIQMPTPCDLLNWETMIAESFPEQVSVDFRVINNAEACAQVVTPQRFKVSFDASEEATIRARFEGRGIELNLIPAAEGETPDEFELFIKG